MDKMNIVAICVAFGFAVAGTAYAQEWPKRKPGLWEAQLSTNCGNVPNMQERLGNMPPEKRAQMEAYMKAARHELRRWVVYADNPLLSHAATSG